MFFNEHNPSHFHAEYQEATQIVLLSDLSENKYIFNQVENKTSLLRFDKPSKFNSYMPDCQFIIAEITPRKSFFWKIWCYGFSKSGKYFFVFPIFWSRFQNATANIFLLPRWESRLFQRTWKHIALFCFFNSNRFQFGNL